MIRKILLKSKLLQNSLSMNPIKTIAWAYSKFTESILIFTTVLNHKETSQAKLPVDNTTPQFQLSAV